MREVYGKDSGTQDEEVLSFGDRTSPGEGGVTDVTQSGAETEVDGEPKVRNRRGAGGVDGERVRNRKEVDGS